MFRLSRTFSDPSSPQNAQRGMPAPGSGAQQTGDATSRVGGGDTRWSARRWLKGRRTWENPSEGQRGFADPFAPGQEYAPGTMPNKPYVYGQNIQVETPYYSRGADAYVQNYGKVLENPIGAGNVVQYRTQASYGISSQYVDDALWWASQTIPTSVNLQGLVDPEALASIIDDINLYAMVRTTA